MVMTLFFLAIMAMLFKYSDIDKWWLWFALIIGMLAQFGYELRVVGLLVAAAIFKVVKEIFSR